MSPVADSYLFNDDLAASVNHLPDAVEKFAHHSSSQDNQESRGVSSMPVDILDTPKEYVLYISVPGLSKSDMRVTLVDENTLVIKSNRKGKRDDGEEEGCKYIRLESRPPKNLLRKFRLPENSNVSAISARCKNGVLTVVVEKLPPPPKPNNVEVAINWLLCSAHPLP